MAAQGDNLKPYQFQPGKSGNPSGKPKQLLTLDKLKSIIDKIALKSVAELEKMATDKNLSAVEMQVTKAMLLSIETGDYSKVSILMDRLLGKVPQTIDQNVKTEDITATKENVAELYDIAKKLHKERA